MHFTSLVRNTQIDSKKMTSKSKSQFKFTTCPSQKQCFLPIQLYYNVCDKYKPWITVITNFYLIQIKYNESN